MKHTPTMRDYELEGEIKYAREQFLSANARTSKLYRWHKWKKLKARRSPAMRAWIDGRRETA